MAEIDDELMARVLQWCTEAGRPASPAEVRDALAPLSWDALLAVRAVLADAPPARPLGPRGLVEVARGADPRESAERERDSARATELEPEQAERSAPAGEEPHPAATKRTRGKGTRRVATVVIRRARDRREEDPSPEGRLAPLVDELFRSEGRSVVERWMRRHGARRARLVEEIAGWRRPDGSPAGEDDVARLLDAHGLARGFERREREEILHALRASGGVLGGAARALGFTPESLASAVTRLDIADDVERIRDERRDDIRRRATLGDRVRLLVDQADRLEDLGMTGEIEADLRERLREHVKALRAGSARHVAPSFARTLGITRDQASSIAARFDLDLRDPAAPAPWRAGEARPQQPGRPPRLPGGPRSPGGARPFGGPPSPGRRPTRQAGSTDRGPIGRSSDQRSPERRPGDRPPVSPDAARTQRTPPPARRLGGWPAKGGLDRGPRRGDRPQGNRPGQGSRRPGAGGAKAGPPRGETSRPRKPPRR